MSLLHFARRCTVPVAAAILFAACGGDSAPSSESTSPAPAGSAAPGNTPSVAPTGKVIIIEMITDETGNYFKPKDIEAERGDVLKFVLTSGVHNVNFPADSNPGAANLPAMTGFAQLPGQAFEILVTMDAGKSYYFQCDPHALLGMIGRVKVED